MTIAVGQSLGHEPLFLRFWGPSPLTSWIARQAGAATALEDWQLALGYVDPLGELAGLLDGKAEAGDPGWRFARALVHRLDGEPRAVVEHRLPEALDFLRQACEADNRMACGELRRANARGRFPRRPGDRGPGR
jgi:hypothetical protein